VKQFRKPWWSLILTKACAKVDILVRQLSGFSTDMEVQLVLEQRIQELHLDIILPTTKAECHEQLQQYKSNLKVIEANSLEVRHAKMTAKANVAAAFGGAWTKKKLDSIRTIKAKWPCDKKSRPSDESTIEVALL
jgi:hypothetical protein